MKQEFITFLRGRKKLNLLMVLINVGIFLFMLLTGDPLSGAYMAEHGAMYPSAVLEDGEYYRLFTCMFLHFGAQHLLYNMLLLLFAGDMLETAAGPVCYLVVYLLGGVIGNIVSLAVNVYTGTEVLSAGASGAIFAVLGGLVFLALRDRGRQGGIQARGVCIMAVLSLVQGFTDAGVDNIAHLGGFLAGFLLTVPFGLCHSSIDRTDESP